MGRPVRTKPVERRFTVGDEVMTWDELMEHIRAVRDQVRAYRGGRPMDVDALLDEVRGLGDQDRG